MHRILQFWESYPNVFIHVPSFFYKRFCFSLVNIVCVHNKVDEHIEGILCRCEKVEWIITVLAALIRKQAVKERCVACPPMPAPFFTTTDESVSCVFLVSSTSTRHICQFFGGHSPLSKVVLCQWPTIWSVLGLGNVGISKWQNKNFFENKCLYSTSDKVANWLEKLVTTLLHSRMLACTRPLCRYPTVVMLCVHLVKMRAVHVQYL